MRPVSIPFPPDRTAPEPATPLLRRRGAALALTVAVHLLLLLMLVRLAPVLQPKPTETTRPATFDLLRDPGIATAAPKSTAKAKRQASAPPARPRPAKLPPVVPPVTAPSDRPLPMMVLTRDEFAAADIAKLPSAQPAQDAASAGNGAGKDSDSAYGPGAGPGGERLYNAEWYRKPGHTELRAALAVYLPQGAPPNGWGEIACKTIENYHVENCRALAESPEGSGIARALRQAAWQFLVRPPRIGGKSLVGSWVRIHIDFTQTAAE